MTDPDGNYATVENYAWVTVLPKPIKVTADDKTKRYGTPDPVFTYHNDPLVEGDTLTGIVFEREHGEANGEYDIIPKQSSGTKSSGNPNPNYDITFVKGTLTISHQTVKIPAPDPRQFFFNGFEQEYYIPESEFYEVRYNKQIFVGTYRVVVYLEEGYIWEDETTGPKYYTFVINPRFIPIPPKEEKEIVLPDPPIDDVLDTEEHTAFINGYPDGTVRPNGNITRAEVATSVNRMLDRHADTAFIDEHLDELRHFTDLEDTTMWYFYEMEEAVNSHEHYFDESDSEVWDSVAGESAD